MTLPTPEELARGIAKRPNLKNALNCSYVSICADREAIAKAMEEWRAKFGDCPTTYEDGWKELLALMRRTEVERKP